MRIPSQFSRPRQLENRPQRPRASASAAPDRGAMEKLIDFTARDSHKKNADASQTLFAQGNRSVHASAAEREAVEGGTLPRWGEANRRGDGWIFARESTRNR
jgi:hypothetical protein